MNKIQTKIIRCAWCGSSVNFGGLEEYTCIGTCPGECYDKLMGHIKKVDSLKEYSKEYHDYFKSIKYSGRPSNILLIEPIINFMLYSGFSMEECRLALDTIKDSLSED